MRKYNKILQVLLLVLFFAVSLTVVSCKNSSGEDKLFETHVKYSEFGAVGDGKTDDFAAIIKTHEYANEHHIAVKADRGAKYYIGAIEKHAEIMTNVDWSGAEFIIDDKSATDDSRVWWHPLFLVTSDSKLQEVSLLSDYSLSAGQQNLGLKFEKDVMLAVYNDEKRDFIRHGFSGDTGWPRQEIILVDKNGNVDSTTPLQWDYSTVTSMKAYAIDDKPILLRGGKFITIANDDPTILHYFERGIKVKRSNVTVKDVVHYITDEGATGSPYNGFYRTEFANNVVFKNCVMSGHKLYKNASGNDQGTYDTRLLSSNNVSYINCTQSNDHTDPTYWGIMCSDYCKNLSMDRCKLSRFDAHMGVYNATITNSDIGQNISVTGGGLLKIENVTKRCLKGTYFNRFVTLREDYGSFFYGDIIIKDSILLTGRGINYVVAGSWYDWDFGYECRFPTTITLDNVQMQYDEDITEYKHPCLYIFSHMAHDERHTPDYVKSSQNPVVIPKKIIIKNNSTEFKMTTNTFGWFEETEMIYQ